MTQVQVIKHRKIFLAIALFLVMTSLVALASFGLKKGIDFSGGTLWQIQFNEQEVLQEDLRKFLITDLGIEEVILTQNELDRAFNIRMGETDETLHQEYSGKIQERFGQIDELSFQTIGAVIGSELVRRASWAIFINLLAIVLYVAYAFRKVSYPVSSWKYGAITLVTLFHDAIIPLGLFALLGRFAGVEIDTNFIVATLVVMGFSVHDTIVVFDRIRENLRNPKKGEFDELVNKSVNETFARSINTSLTLVVVLAALFVLGAITLKYFILVILAGTILGTYSSIFIASPLLTIWRRKGR